MKHRLTKIIQTSIKGETKLLSSCAIQEIGENFVVYKDSDAIYAYTIGDATDPGDI